MGVYYSLAYGIATTDQFGGKLQTIPQALFDFSSEQRDNKELVQRMPTEEDYALVIGVNVEEGPTNGITWREGEDTLKLVHQRYLETLSQCPESIRALIQEHTLVPRLCVLAGDF